MSYRLSSLLITTTWIGCLLGIFNLLGPDALFVLIPTACMGLGYMVGRRMQYPLTGAVVGASIFLCYIATMPLVGLLCGMLFQQSNWVAFVMNCYWMPYGEWADCLGAREIIGPWEDFASRMPMVAAVFVFVVISGINVITIAVER